MRISGIDPDFVDIIEYLNEAEYKPFASCDGVLANHTNPEEVEAAYISFLESPKIVELMSLLLKDGRYTIAFTSSTHKEPYEYYGNEISGNTYSVYFYNENGELTSQFKDIIMQAGKENTDDHYMDILSRLSNRLKDDENSQLEFSVELSLKMQPNKLSITNKSGYEQKKDMNSLLNMLYEKFPEDSIDVDHYTKKVSGFDILFSYDQFEQILEIISYCRSIEDDLSILESSTTQSDFMKNANRTVQRAFRIGSIYRLAEGRNITGVRNICSQLHNDREHGEKVDEGEFNI